MGTEEISENEYKVTKCLIINEECYISSCINCDTAKEAEHIKQCEEDSTYLFTNKTTKVNGVHYQINSRYTVLKASINDLCVLVEYFLSVPNMILSMNPKIIKDSYPEWEKTRKLNNIDEKAKKYYYREGKPLIIVYEKEIYIVMPILRNQ